MCHVGRNLAERFDTTERLGQGEDLGLLAELAGPLLAALDTERQHASAHSVAVLLDGNLALGVGVEAGVIDVEDVLVLDEGVGNEGGVGGGLAGTEVEGLQAAVGEPRVESGGDGADGVLEEGEAGVEGGRVEGGNTHNDILDSVRYARSLGGLGRLTLWPLMYLVTEWTTMSAPWARGFWI